MEGVMLNEVGGGKKEAVCAQLSCGDPQVSVRKIPFSAIIRSLIRTDLKSLVITISPPWLRAYTLAT